VLGRAILAGLEGYHGVCCFVFAWRGALKSGAKIMPKECQNRTISDEVWGTSSPWK
jgi:hypothetical protein